MLLKVLVGKTSEGAAKGDFRTQVKTLDIVDIEVQADYILAGGQAIFKADKALVRTVADIAVSPLDLEEHRLALAVDLEVRGDLDAVIVGDHQFELDFLDLLEGGNHVVGLLAEVAGDIVGKFQRLGAVGLDNAGTPHAAARRRHDLGMIDAVDDNALGEELGAATAVFGTVVGKPEDDGFDIAAVLGLGQHAVERVVAELTAGRKIGDIQISETQTGEIAQLYFGVQAEKVGHISQDLPQRVFELYRGAGRSQARSQKRHRVFIGGKIPLHAIKGRLGKGQGCEGCAQGFANGHRRIELPLGHR